MNDIENKLRKFMSDVNDLKHDLSNNSDNLEEHFEKLSEETNSWINKNDMTEKDKKEYTAINTKVSNLVTTIGNNVGLLDELLIEINYYVDTHDKEKLYDNV